MQLLAQLPPKYVALLAKRYVVGARIPLMVEPPPALYYVYLSRPERLPYTQIWPASLRQQLPVVPVPLLHPDLDVILDLQAAVDACFAQAGYERLLGYADPSLPPPSPGWMTCCAGPACADPCWDPLIVAVAGLLTEPRHGTVDGDPNGCGEGTGNSTANRKQRMVAGVVMC